MLQCKKNNLLMVLRTGFILIVFISVFWFCDEIWPAHVSAKHSIRVNKQEVTSPVVSSWSPTSNASLSVDEWAVDRQHRYWREKNIETWISLTHTHTHTLTHTHTHSLTHTHWHTHTNRHTHSLTHSLTHSHWHTDTHTQTHTHTHTQTCRQSNTHHPAVGVSQ